MLLYSSRVVVFHHAAQAFLEGFWQLVPRELICIFNDHELELLISGLPDIDVADLRANTEYTGFSPNSPVIQWFWQVVADMDKQDLALLLQFVTGGKSRPSSAGAVMAVAVHVVGCSSTACTCRWCGRQQAYNVQSKLRCFGFVLC
jgi:hypothetical protein